MLVLILGVDHEIQRVDAWRSEEMKAAYRDLLGVLVAKHGIQFICEEANPTNETVGAQLTVSLELPFPWKQIDMVEGERRAAGIFEEQNKRIAVPRLGEVKTHLADDGFHQAWKNGWHLFWPRVPSDSVREDYMVEHAARYAGEAKRIMVLCGNHHVEELARKFRARGDEVETDALYKYDWYDPG